jgi:hypothetical protein
MAWRALSRFEEGLYDQKDFIEQVRKHYDKLDTEIKAVVTHMFWAQRPPYKE